MSNEEIKRARKELKERKKELLLAYRTETEAIKWDIKNNVSEDDSTEEIRAEIECNLDYYRRFVEMLEDLLEKFEELADAEMNLDDEEEELEQKDEENE